MSVTYNLGRVLIVHRGEWDSATEYERLDIVSLNGASYLVTADCTGTEPPNDDYYALIAEKGDTGEAGADGADGADGETPTVELAQTDSGYTLTINGTTVELTNGTDGADGADGTDGTDGESHTVTLTRTDSGYTLTIDDTSVEITNGADGADGASAYDAAVAGGYTGTEEDFNTALAAIFEMAIAEEVEW